MRNTEDCRSRMPVSGNLAYRTMSVWLVFLTQCRFLLYKFNSFFSAVNDFENRLRFDKVIYRHEFGGPVFFGTQRILISNYSKVALAFCWLAWVCLLFTMTLDSSKFKWTVNTSENAPKYFISKEKFEFFPRRGGIRLTDLTSSRKGRYVPQSPAPIAAFISH